MEAPSPSILPEIELAPKQSEEAALNLEPFDSPFESSKKSEQSFGEWADSEFLQQANEQPRPDDSEPFNENNLLKGLKSAKSQPDTIVV